MSLQEWWWEADSKIAVSRKLIKKAGGFTEQEWIEARRKHRDKKAQMNG